MNANSNDLQLVVEDGVLKVIGTHQALIDTTTLTIASIDEASELDRDSLLKLMNLEELSIAKCPKLVLFPSWISEFQKLKKIYLRDVFFCTENDNTLCLPTCLKELTVIYSEIGDPFNSFSFESFGNIINPRSVVVFNGIIVGQHISPLETTNSEAMSVCYSGSFKQPHDNLQSSVNIKLVVIEDALKNISPTAILYTISNLKSLESIRVIGGHYTSLPESLKELPKLESLYLMIKSLDTLPAWVDGFESLTNIFWSVFGRDTEMPNFVGNLSNLRTLCLQDCSSANGLDSIFNLTNLARLSLGHIRLNRLSESVGCLLNLRELDLSRNRLTALPESVWTLVNLEYLNISNNRLTSIPQSIRNLPQLTLLDLRGNNIPDIPEDGSLGRIELRRIFGDRVVLDNPQTRFKRVSEKGVYKKLKKKRLCWNFEKLKSFKPKPVQKIKLDENGMIEALHRLIGRITADECDVMAEYVRKLFDPQRKYKGWAMIEKYIEETKNLLGNILESDASCIDFSLIAEAIREYCPDRQMGELRQAYHMLKNERRHSDDLEEFVSTHIAAEKEYLFDYAITPGTSGQSVHVLNHWKHKLRDDLGFDFEFKTKIGTMEQDPFQDSNGNALDAFFSVFTPEYVIRTLTDAINGNKPVMCKLMEIIVNDEELTVEDRSKMGLVEDHLQYCTVNEKAIEYYLVKKEIIVIGKFTAEGAIFNCFLFPIRLIYELFG